MIAWMLYSVIVGALIVGAASAAESVARLVRVPVRWAWVGAIVVIVALSAIAPYRAMSPAESSTSISTSVASLPLGAGVELASRGLPRATSTYLAAGWILVSLALVVLLAAVHARTRRARRAWPLADLHGARVRLSPATGPVVIGFARPEIVVPRWLLSRHEDEQKLIVAHENEHVRARDALVLNAACAAVAVMPWNPALWFALSRLRLAVELDCDARVLRRGVPVAEYGGLLIDLATQPSSLRFTPAALAITSSHLHQRIAAMKRNVPRFARARAGVAAVFGAGLILAACEAKMPTSAEVEALDVAATERKLAELRVLGATDPAAVYLVDGKAVSRAEAMALKPSEIATVEVRKDGTNDVLKKIVIATHSASGKLAPVEEEVERKKVDAALRVRRTTGELVELANEPMVLIDGVRSASSALRNLDRSAISSIEVVKGKAAAAAYGEDAKNGVIVVTTKK